MKKLISICIPVYNESCNVENIYKEINKNITEYTAHYDFEFIFTDNNSSDDTFEYIEKLNKVNKKVTGYSFSKNIGKERSLFYAFSKTKGEAVIQIDCDLEDPPELLINFIDQWNNGYDIVYGIRKKRKKDKFAFFRFVFYRLLNFLSEAHLPNDSGDFRLCSRKVIDKILEVKDDDPYIRGLISSIGFKSIGIPHERNLRIINKSKFTFFSYLNNSLNAFVNHSIAPLRIASLMGFFVFIITSLLSLVYLFHYIFFETKVPGFTTQTLLILFGISFNSLFLGIIGEYIGRLTRHVKKNDLFIIKKKTN